MGRWTTPDYIAGEYLFSKGLVSLAASTPVFAFYQFEQSTYVLLMQGLPVYKALIPNGVGVNILGDLTLHLPVQTYSGAPDLQLSQSSIQISSDTKKPIEMKIKNNGKQTLYFTDTIKDIMQSGKRYLKGGCGFASNATQKNGVNELLPGQSADLTFDPICFDHDADLPAGTYKKEILFVSNDPKKPLIEFPITFVNKK